MTEKTICNALNSKYAGNCKYKLANAFIFKRDWESDFFVQKQNGYAYEFEVKISRSDFFNDKKKVDKHLILETGMFTRKGQFQSWNKELNKWNYEEQTMPEEHKLRPNKFYYVVPSGLIGIDEVPQYAGLMYVHEKGYLDIVTVKEAPFIHKERLDFESVLCSKFYAYWLDAKRTIIELESDIKMLKWEQNPERSVATNVDSSNTDR
jgi:hypothetical protein